MDPFVVDMHTTSGLLAELAGGVTLQEAQERVLAYVRAWAVSYTHLDVYKRQPLHYPLCYGGRQRAGPGVVSAPV